MYQQCKAACQLQMTAKDDMLQHTFQSEKGKNEGLKLSGSTINFGALLINLLSFPTNMSIFTTTTMPLPFLVAKWLTLGLSTIPDYR